MLEVSQTVVISSSPAEVFAALADPQIQIRYDSATYRSSEQLTSGPIGKGTRFRGKFKGMGSVEYEYDEYKEDSLIQHYVRMPFGAARHRFEFEPVDGDTRLTQWMRIEPNALGRILWPVAIKRMMVKRLTELNGRVKRYVETQS